MKKYQYIPKRKKNTTLLYQVSLANFFYFLGIVCAWLQTASSTD